MKVIIREGNKLIVYVKAQPVIPREGVESDVGSRAPSEGGKSDPERGS